MRIQEAQNHADPKDPGPDPEHCHLSSNSFLFPSPYGSYQPAGCDCDYLITVKAVLGTYSIFSAGVRNCETRS
jgi:hypothetical protein